MMKLRLVFTLFLFSVFFKSFAQPGSLDASFAGKGLQTYSFKQNNSSEDVTASALDSKGNLFIAGLQTTNFTQPFVVKMLPSGKLDLSFGKQGRASMDVFPPFSFTFYPHAIAAHPDGGVVLAGYRTASTYTFPCIVKLTAGGALDPNFYGSGTGYVEFNSAPALSGPGAEFTAVHLTPAGEIVATGGTEDRTSSNGNFLVAKVDAYSGAAIAFTSPGNNIVTVSYLSGAHSTASVVKGNRIYLAGNMKDQGSGENHFALAEVNLQTGDLDTSTITLPINGPSMVAHTCTAIDVTNAKRIVLGGYATNSFGTSSFMIYKLQADRSLGYLKFYPIGSSTDSKVFSMLVHSNESIVLGGSVYDGTNYTWSLLRTQSDGLVDQTFGQGGTGVQSFTVPTGLNHGVTGLHALPDGSYLLDATVRYIPSGETDIKVKKISSTGAAVSAFANNSEGTFWASNADSYIKDISIRKDGQVFVCGYYNDISTSSKVPVIASIKSDGTLDPSFGGSSGADPGVVKLSDIIPANIQSNFDASAILVQDDNKILIAGQYFKFSADNDYVFLIRLNSNGSLETSFNSSNGYADYLRGSGYTHDIAVQKDQKILVYGYAGGVLTLARFSAGGVLDTGFAGGGIYQHPQTGIADYDMTKVEVKVQPDQKIVAVGTSSIFGENNFLAFRLDAQGALDLGFGPDSTGAFIYNFPSNDDDFAMTLCLKPDGKIVIGGFTQHTAPVVAVYALVQLTNQGNIDSTFGSGGNGIVELNKNFSNHNIIDLEAESNNAILAMGAVQDSKGDMSFTAMRFNGAGSLDNTFTGRGHVLLGKGYGMQGALYNGGFYLAGGTDFPENAPIDAEIIKLRLGTGPVIKTTHLQLSDVLKTFGDEPFTLQAVTNSPAAIQYTLTHGTCAEVHPTSGLVKITCVPDSPDHYLAIKAYQPATVGFTEDSVKITVNVAKAIPTIIFNTQGGLVDSTILLRAISNSPGAMGFDLLSDSDNALEFLGGGNVLIEGIGCGLVQVSLEETQNYLSGTATAEVCGYNALILPFAFDDELIIEAQSSVTPSINVLVNDESYTGSIIASQVDLDPSTPEVDSIYISPALGRFAVDTLGNVRYTPFQGFVGAGSIAYTIRDSEGSVSLPGMLSVKYVSTETPELKATELFTPNKDGLNDAFVIGYVDLQKENRLKIFDRNGQELFSQNNYRNDWTGELPNGKQAENGIYYYVFQEGNNGSARELKGVVELKR